MIRGWFGLAGLGALAREAEAWRLVQKVPFGHLDDRVPVVLAHREEHAVTQDPRVVDHDVEAAEDVDGLADDALAPVPGGDVVGVGHGLPAGGDDLVDHLLGGPDVTAGAVTAAADVVDHDLRPVRGQEERVRPMPRPEPVTMQMRPSQSFAMRFLPLLSRRGRSAVLRGRPARAAPDAGACPSCSLESIAHLLSSSAGKATSYHPAIRLSLSRRQSSSPNAPRGACRRGYGGNSGEFSPCRQKRAKCGGSDGRISR